MSFPTLGRADELHGKRTASRGLNALAEDGPDATWPDFVNPWIPAVQKQDPNSSKGERGGRLINRKCAEFTLVFPWQTYFRSFLLFLFLTLLLILSMLRL
jgi:hypothetical protein